MNLEEVKQFLEENKEQEDVAEYLKGFTQVTKEDYDAIVSERDELLQHKPKELTEDEKAMQEKQQDLWQREVNLSLKEKGLEPFADVVHVNNQEELDTATEALESALNDYKVENAYVPTEHATEDVYNTAKDSGDTKGMIKSLFGFN